MDDFLFGIGGFADVAAPAGFETLNLEGFASSSLLDFRHKSNVLNSLISSSSASDLSEGFILTFSRVSFKLIR